MIARLHEQVPGPLRAVRIDALQVLLVGGEAEFAEFLRLIDDDLVDADLFQWSPCRRAGSSAPPASRSSFSFIASSRLRVIAVVLSSSRSMSSAQLAICSSIIARSKAAGTGMKRNAAWVMITASQFAVAARARKR